MQDDNTLKHTPGPWHVIQYNHVDGELWLGIGWTETLADGSTRKIGPICDWHRGAPEFRHLIAPEAEQWANAHLIAAAPDLLQALRDCYAMAIVFAAMYAEQRGLKSGERVWQHAEALSKARAALDKAEGRS